MTLIIILIIQIVGWLTAYPRNKKWIIENETLTNSIWTNLDMLKALGTCFFLWWGVWIWVFFQWLEDLEFKGWFNKKAKF